MAEKTEAIPLLLALDKAKIQDSFCYRALFLARALALSLVDEKGQLHRFEGPLENADETIFEHQTNFLNRWNQDREFVKKFRRFSLPICHRKAEEMVRATLQFPYTAILTDAHIRRAAVCACLTPLRQSVGSCFATAPAILAQKHALDLFVDDLYELLTAGRLRRVVEGNQYTVPFSLSFGVGDLNKIIDPISEFWGSPGMIAALESAHLISPQASFEQKIKCAHEVLFPAYHPSMTVENLLKKVIVSQKLEPALIAFKSTTENALLKAWEFTLASFSDIKMEFARWNLSWSLGLDPREKEGIGEILYVALEAKLQDANQKIEEYHHAVIEAFDKVKTSENLMRQASTEAQIRRYRAEVQAGLHHLRSCEELRDEFQQKAKIYAELFPFLNRQFTAKFQEYFQEIYDPEMPELFTGPYEDRMAGFRLVYKHGRHDSSLWTSVYDPQQFIKVLAEFFTAIEPYIAYSLENPVEKKIIEEITTLIIQHVQSDRFIQAAMRRAAIYGRMPWAYLSGGTMDQLIPIYFRYSSPPLKESREIQDELDLFVFLLETLKGLSPQITERFLKDATQGLLIESPTHAFSLLPGLGLFCEGWSDTGFTYTWIRDRFLLPNKAFYQEMKLTREMQRDLMRRLSIYGETSSSASIEMFSSQCPQVPRKELEAFLYRTLPLIPADQCKSVLQKMGPTNQIALPSSLTDYVSSQEIQQLAQAHVRHAAASARELKLAPTPCLFADTNWPQGYFAFVVNPISLNLEVWKSDKMGSYASPLPLVKLWLGKGKEFTWSIFVNKI